MLEAARANYPSGNFCGGNFLEDDLPPHDLILASGSLNYVFGAVEDQRARIEGLIKKAWTEARRVFAFNLLDAAARPSGGGDRYLYYAEKAHFLAYCKNLCPGAFLTDGYLDNDFTIVMKK
jgi:hypothetical protein